MTATATAEKGGELLIDPDALLDQIEVQHVHADNKIDCRVPIDLIDTEEVAVEHAHAKWLAEEIINEADETGTDGQGQRIVLALIDGEPDFKIEDGFHRTKAFAIIKEVAEMEGVEAPTHLNATIKKNTWDRLLDQRIADTHRHPHLRFSRVVDWIQQSWALTPMSEHLTVSQALVLTTESLGGTGKRLGADEQTVEQAREWVSEKSQRWGFSAMTVHTDLRVAEQVDPNIVRAVRVKQGGHELTAPTPTIAKTLSEELGYKSEEDDKELLFALQNLTVQQAMQHNHNAPQVRAVAQLIKDARTPEEAVELLEANDIANIKGVHKRTPSGKLRASADPAQKGAKVLSKAFDEIDRIDQRTRQWDERDEEHSPEAIPDLEQTIAKARLMQGMLGRIIALSEEEIEAIHEAERERERQEAEQARLAAEARERYAELIPEVTLEEGTPRPTLTGKADERFGEGIVRWLYGEQPTMPSLRSDEALAFVRYQLGLKKVEGAVFERALQLAEIAKTAMEEQERAENSLAELAEGMGKTLEVGDSISTRAQKWNTSMVKYLKGERQSPPPLASRDHIEGLQVLLGSDLSAYPLSRRRALLTLANESIALGIRLDRKDRAKQELEEKLRERAEAAEAREARFALIDIRQLETVDVGEFKPGKTESFTERLDPVRDSEKGAVFPKITSPQMLNIAIAYVKEHGSEMDEKARERFLSAIYEAQASYQEEELELNARNAALKKRRQERRDRLALQKQQALWADDPNDQFAPSNEAKNYKAGLARSLTHTAQLLLPTTAREFKLAREVLGELGSKYPADRVKYLLEYIQGAVVAVMDPSSVPPDSEREPLPPPPPPPEVPAPAKKAAKKAAASPVPAAASKKAAPKTPTPRPVAKKQAAQRPAPRPRAASRPPLRATERSAPQASEGDSFRDRFNEWAEEDKGQGGAGFITKRFHVRVARNWLRENGGTIPPARAARIEEAIDAAEERLSEGRRARRRI